MVGTAWRSGANPVDVEIDLARADLRTDDALDGSTPVPQLAVPPLVRPDNSPVRFIDWRRTLTVLFCV